MKTESKWIVLVVEDDPDDYILTRDFLTSSRPGQYCITRADSYDSALRLVGETPPDVILVDFHLGGHTGLDFLRAARMKGCRVPAILLTGVSSYELDVEAMKAGVSDYLEKGQLSAPLLERAIRYAIERHQIQGRLEEMNEALEARVAQRTQALEEANKALEYQAYLLEHVNDAIVAFDTNLVYITWNRAAEQIYGWKREEVAGKHFGEVLLTKFACGDREDCLRELVAAGQYQGEVVQTCKDGRTVPVDMKITSLHDEHGNLTGYVSIHRDITARRQAEEQVRQVYARVEAQAELSRLLAGANLDYRKMLEILARRVAELIGDACQVAQLSSDGQALVPAAFYHPDPNGARVVAELWQTTVNRSGEGLGWKAARNGTPVLEPVVPQNAMRGQLNPELWPLLDRFGIHSVLIVPLIIQDKLFGILGVTRDCPGRSYSVEDQVFLEALAGRAALLIANARLYEEAQTELLERKRMEAELNEIQRRLTDGAEAERLQLARELHDGPIQDMYALALQLRMLDELFPGGENDENMAALQGSIQRVIDSLRATSIELRPPVLARFGLAAAIRSHCEQIRRMQPGLKFQFDIQGEKRPPAGTEKLARPAALAAQAAAKVPIAPAVAVPALSERARLALFRIYQVAINNSIRHARASQVTIRLKEEGEMAVLEIEDDGVGFQVPGRWVEIARKGHLGLLGGFERAESVGGRMQVISSPGKGTIVRVVVPKEA